MQHVDDPAEIRTTAFPLSVVGIDNQVVLAVDAFVSPQFVKLHAVEQRFIHAISNATAERGRVVILLDFPNSDRIDRCRKCAVDPSGQSSWRDSGILP